MQFGFQKERSTTDAVFVMRKLQEGYKKIKMYHVFVESGEGFWHSSRRSDSMGFEKADGS